jgi:ankyrin repeat protein
MNRFRLVACQLEELKECARSQKTLEYILEGLPVTLEATYDQILSRISPANASDAVKLLLWLAFAEQPLKIDYLAVIVEFDMDKKTFDPKARLSAPTDILRICSSLVTKMWNNTVKLAHASVNKYVMEKKRTIQSNIVMDPSMGNAFVGQCCLAYILCSEQKVDNRNPLMRYCAKYWPKHIIAANCEAAVIQQMKKLFVFTSPSFQHWVDVYNVNSLYNDSKMQSQSPLQCAALHGLNAIIEWLLQSVVTDVEIANALFAAAHYGHLAAVEALVNHINNHAQVGKAIKHVLDLLLGKASSRKEGMQNALYIASNQGHKEIVIFLLQRGTDVNAQGHYGNALQNASYQGHEDVVQLLLERGADVNAQGGHFGNALQHASCTGHKEIVQLLLEGGADVNAQGGRYRNALQAASYTGHKEIVQLLLEGGADVNAQGGPDLDGNALQAASNRGHKDIVQLLLERGADVNAQGEFGETALEGASEKGHKEVVKLLLERGADVNAQGGLKGNALTAASYEGHDEVVQLLLEGGADVNAQCGIYTTALQAASYQGHFGTVQLLLQSGAEVNDKLRNHDALEVASERGRKDIVKLLLDHGVEQECLNTALHSASERDIVNLLLEYGARYW